jgi:hypothetical protein
VFGGDEGADLQNGDFVEGDKNLNKGGDDENRKGNNSKRVKFQLDEPAEYVDPHMEVMDEQIMERPHP